MTESQKFSEPALKKSGITRTTRLIICLAILSAGLLIAVYIQKTKPEARKKIQVKTVPMVTVRQMFPTSRQMTVSAMGTVIPARETVLKSRVAGEVISVHPEFIEGGYVQKDAEIILIDSKDYKLQVAQSASAVIAAEYALKLEMGHQEVARREWDLIRKEQPVEIQDAELALRKPHLEKAEADLAAARAEHAQAELNLSRTTIRSPYNAIIRKKMVDIGSQVAAQGQLAEIMGVDEYRIQVSLPTEKLTYIDFPKKSSDTGSSASIIYRNGVSRSGRVVKLLGDLETEGRMARLLISVKDPLGLSSSGEQSAPLLIGEYVRVEIQGPVLENVYQISNSALHDNRNIWVIGENQTLEIRSVQVLWRTADSVFLNNGLNPGDQLIHSEIPVPVSGMELQVQPAASN
ncbi:MAG: efflux RND transporter periplasmic adaptor subunit [Pseudomonadota bacterium]